MTIADFIKEQRLKFACVSIPMRTDKVAAEWNQDRGTHHYRCQIRKGRRSMVVYFSQGSAHTEAPTLASVLSCVASDIVSVQNSGSFEEWCSSFGYDTDSRRAYDCFKLIEKQEERLTRVIDDSEAMNTLLYKIKED